MTLLDTIDRQRAALLASVSALSPAQQQWRDTPTSWSALDVVEHLVRAEQVVLGDVGTAAQRMGMPRHFKHRVRRLLVWLVLRLGVRVSVPAEAMRPTGARSLNELCAQWDDQHRAIRSFVQQGAGDAHRRRVFRHPIAGPLDIHEALQLLSAHLRTHQRQIERLIRSQARG